MRHAHAVFNAAKVAADQAVVRRNLRIEKAKFRLRNKGEKVNIVNAMMEDDEIIVALEEELSVVESKVKLLDAVAMGYADIRDAASREITRRIGERAQAD